MIPHFAVAACGFINLVGVCLINAQKLETLEDTAKIDLTCYYLAVGANMS